MNVNKKNITPWLAYCRPSPQARLRLFCFPFAGGGATAYRDWARKLPEDIDVCPVQLPGRETRIGEPAYTRMGPLVEAAILALSPYLDIPFCFFGHSMGALVSFELARRLRRTRRLEPDVLIVSGCGAPHTPYRSSIRYDLPENDMFRELAKLDGTPREVLESAELMQLMLPTLRADLEVCELYRYTKEPPLACSITVFGGVEDPWVPQEDLEAWREHTQGDFRIHLFAGGHFFILNVKEELLVALGSHL